MASHTRTRTGCWTCREAGYKCDEQKPYCGRCTRLNITCKGYGTKFKWRNTTTAPAPSRRHRDERRGKSIEQQTALSPISTSSIVSATAVLDAPGLSSPQEWMYDAALTPVAMPDMVPDLPAGDRRLLHYWIEYLSSLISVTPGRGQPSSFQQHLTSMTFNPGALRSTVLSMAANHLALASNDSSMRIHAYRHQRDAIRLLQQLIQTPMEIDTEPSLATVLMMQVSARLFGDEDAEPQVANHLIGAKAMVVRRGGLAAWSTSSSERFLLSLFAYHDILSSVSRGSRPFLDHGTEFTAIEGAPSMQSIAKVLHVVARISELQHIAKSDPRLFGQLHILGSSIEGALRDLDFSFSSTPGTEDWAESTDIRLTAEAYRHAAFIYLYRVWLDVGAPNPTTLHHVQQCLACIKQVGIGSSLVSSHIWPLWTAGCEAVDSEQRQFVRDRFQAMFRTRMFPSLKRIVRDIEDVWTCKDTERIVSGRDGMQKVDCIQVILSRRGREVDLA
ncbi:hypothetical protein K469DRAFT_688606 [Zopfia rhizophila CBS 207.26]|uniref:Zn(2)-C6 fungal-type domain-containing protein n=1 Tax=Zopfia rhizophila CBS 207.26 TaxID=1314779 RepID=A0A6A6E1Z9_9PEZI|nr:hypothetical protein K469DRAFT_688606 [Zopfia rhizophila CBS 207.26]